MYFKIFSKKKMKKIKTITKKVSKKGEKISNFPVIIEIQSSARRNALGLMPCVIWLASRKYQAVSLFYKADN